MKAFAQRGILLEKLNSLDPLLYPLLRWIIISNRAHLRLLADSERMASIGTQYQFVLLNSTPEAEITFQSIKRTCENQKGKGSGSVYAFHGSSTGNWHSILRTGLKNMSGTKYMEHGAAHGNGIYMATDSATSLGYCQQHAGWDKSMFGISITCLALCEVVNHQNLKPPTPYYVISEESWVTTRFVFVFDRNKGTGSSISIKGIEKEIPNLMIGQVTEGKFGSKTNRDFRGSKALKPGGTKPKSTTSSPGRLNSILGFNNSNKKPKQGS